jgi:hypothetical protein
LEFSDIDFATTFLDKFYPSVRLYGKSNESVAITIAFSRDDRGHDNRNKSRDITWVCGNVIAQSTRLIYPGTNMDKVLTSKL